MSKVHSNASEAFRMHVIGSASRAPHMIGALVAALVAACTNTGTDASDTDGSVESAGQALVKCVEGPKIDQPPFDLMPELRGEGGVRYKPIARKPLCDKGQVPEVTPLRPVVDRRNPLIAADRMIGVDPQLRYIDRPEVKALIPLERLTKPQQREPLPPDPAGECDGVDNSGTCYYYADAAYWRVADGGGMITTVERPAYSSVGGGGHTLNELAVQGGPDDGHIVEIGWNVSTEQYGNAHPHLFVFHWNNWSPTCYDGCGWVQYSAAYFPGQDLNGIVGREVYIGYVQYRGNWWAWFDNQWLGYFPGSEWPSGYAQTSLIQWFGEVATHNGVPPVSDMGDGQFPAGASPARMSALCDVDAAAWVCWYRDQQGNSATVPKYYDIARTGFGRVAYGGDGGG